MSSNVCVEDGRNGPLLREVNNLAFINSCADQGGRKTTNKPVTAWLLSHVNPCPCEEACTANRSRLPIFRSARREHAPWIITALRHCQAACIRVCNTPRSDCRLVSSPDQRLLSLPLRRSAPDIEAAGSLLALRELRRRERLLHARICGSTRHCVMGLAHEHIRSAINIL